MSSQDNNIPKHLQSSQNQPQNPASLGIYSQTQRNSAGASSNAASEKSASFGGTKKISKIKFARVPAENADTSDTMKSAVVRPGAVPPKIHPSESWPGNKPSQDQADTETLFPQSGLKYPPVRRLPAMPAEIMLNVPSQVSNETTNILPVIIRGAAKPITHPIVTPSLSPKAKARAHSFVITGLIGVLIVLTITLTPLTMVRADPLSHWMAGVAQFTPPTPTATSAPAPIKSVQPYYAPHPVVSGVWNFICAALPYARMAQQDQEQAGMRPWYVSVILSQWGIEDGWTMPTYTGYNFGNTSALSGYPWIAGLPVAGSPTAFAYAYTPAQGVFYYVTFSKMGYYVGVSAAYYSGPVAQMLALGASPWDADHYAINGRYGAKLLNNYYTFNLQRFDNPSVNC